MTICTIGSGYVGLVTGACFAEKGWNVVGVDIDEAKVAALTRGECPIYEPGLPEMLQRHQLSKRLHFTTSLDEGLAQANFVFIAVGTPSAAGGEADLSAVFTVVDSLAERIDPAVTVVVKSTVPVGTCRRIQSRFRELLGDRAPEVAMNPEFLREGIAIRDALEPERIVIGGGAPDARMKLRKLYGPFIGDDTVFYETSLESAEMIKYASNAMLATRISFINEIANVCELTGADVDEVATGMGLDSRIGPKFLKAGVGYGGSCFPKDVSALVQLAESLRYDPRILKAVTAVNQDQPKRILDKLEIFFPDGISGLTFCVWGLAFKPETDDIREAPSLKLIPELAARGAQIRAFDPEATDNARHVLPASVVYGDDPLDAADGADGIILLTEWQAFHKPDWEVLKQKLQRPLIIDGRNLYHPETMARLGFDYAGIGRHKAGE